MNASRIAPLALYQEVAERLRQRIFSHELPPGTWVDEQALAAQYGISRTPLREALKVLAAEGLVTLKPRRGCYVTEISERDLDEIFTVMALLEGQCAVDTARKASESDLVRLRSIHDDLERATVAKDIDGFFEANQAFHQEIQLIADNRWLTQAITDLRKVIKLSRHHSLFSEGRLEQSLAEHQVILEALSRRDICATEQAMRGHIASGRKALAKIAAQRESAA
ncbi:GntR family transcriptional regulator [Zoogloea sp.]|uniref:GntR family transcriptional regulator n=1 Tax=Zoogloea sp. TaxID=49181 RepID=UPI002603A0C9|nr:GntR family transcriptional regulator [Zoogloea sp.]MDD3353029.1 GntR family transcriptional regulator [Zoogloea sp.]